MRKQSEPVDKAAGKDSAEKTAQADTAESRRCAYIEWQLSRLVPLKEGVSKSSREAEIRALAELVNGLGARDTADLMLATQMVSTHYLSMRAMAHAANCGDPDLTITLSKEGTRLTASYAKNLELLDKRHGRPQQIIRVDHVRVTNPPPSIDVVPQAQCPIEISEVKEAPKSPEIARKPVRKARLSVV